AARARDSLAPRRTASVGANELLGLAAQFRILALSRLLEGSQWGDTAMLKLRTILFAGAFAVAAAPAIAVDLPDYGSKNFSPAGDTPSYFANEAAPVSARTADTTARDWSAVDEIAPSRSSEGVRSAYSHRGRHGRYS